MWLKLILTIPSILLAIKDLVLFFRKSPKQETCTKQDTDVK